MPPADEPEVTWTWDDYADAKQQGWGFFPPNGVFQSMSDWNGRRHFQSTEEALAHVLARAEAGDELAQKAVRVIALNAARRRA